MSTPAKLIPEGMHSVTPHLCCAGAADAIDFHKRAFNAVELGRLAAPNGKIMHAQIKISDSALMLVDEDPAYSVLGTKALKGSPVTIHLYVEDVDAVVKQAEAAGAKVMAGRRHILGRPLRPSGRPVRGINGRVATHQRECMPEDIKKAMAAMSQPGA